MEFQAALGMLRRVAKELTEQKVHEQLTVFDAALKATVASPTPPNDETFKKALNDVNSMLEKAPSNHWAPTDRRILESLHLAKWVGRGLRAQIALVLEDNLHTRALASQKIEALIAKLQEVRNWLGGIQKSFTGIGVKPVEAANASSTECEISIVIPNTEDKQTLHDLDLEFSGFNKLLRNINEISGRTGESPRVVGLSTGSWIVAIQMTVEAALKFVEIVRAIYDIRNAVKDLKSKSDGLRAEPDVPPALIETLDKLVETRVTEGLRKLADDTAAKRTDLDQGRRNELANGLSIGIKFLAGRLDHGVQIEVTPPALPKADTVTPEALQTIQVNIVALQQSAAQISQMAAKNDSPILLLDRDVSRE